MRFLGFFYLREWDGSISRCSAKTERASLNDFLKYDVDYWVYICYEVDNVQRVDERYFKSIVVGQIEANPSRYR